MNLCLPTYQTKLTTTSTLLPLTKSQWVFLKENLNPLIRCCFTFVYVRTTLINLLRRLLRRFNSGLSSIFRSDHRGSFWFFLCVILCVFILVLIYNYIENWHDRVIIGLNIFFSNTRKKGEIVNAVWISSNYGNNVDLAIIWNKRFVEYSKWQKNDHRHA